MKNNARLLVNVFVCVFTFGHYKLLTLRNHTSRRIEVLMDKVRNNMTRHTYRGIIYLYSTSKVTSICKILCLE